jgi:hypothetical protein
LTIGKNACDDGNNNCNGNLNRVADNECDFGDDQCNIAKESEEVL